MRVFHVGAEGFVELPALPQQMPASGFVWIGIARPAFGESTADIQAALQRLGAGLLLDLHVSDLLNQQLPSHFDYTSGYELLVFRRLVAGAPSPQHRTLVAVDTSPVGFAVFDRVLLTVHSAECAVRDHFAQRLAALAVGEGRNGTRLPASPPDLMLRMVNHMVDGYLDLRRHLSRALGALQQELLDPRSRFRDWNALLDARNALTLLEDSCEDQLSAVQEWIDALDEWPEAADPQERHERELLRVRSRDVLEHVTRVLSHVRRLGLSVESAVQLHFAALSQRTNEIMRTLTVLTAIFLPLNLITGFFGMNFDALPLIHSATGMWVALVAMGAVGAGMVALFRRKRFLGSD